MNGRMDAAGNRTQLLFSLLPKNAPITLSALYCQKKKSQTELNNNHGQARNRTWDLFQSKVVIALPLSYLPLSTSTYTSIKIYAKKYAENKKKGKGRNHGHGRNRTLQPPSPNSGCSSNELHALFIE